MVVKPVGGLGKVEAGGIVDRSWRGRICLWGGEALRTSRSM